MPTSTVDRVLDYVTENYHIKHDDMEVTKGSSHFKIKVSFNNRVITITVPCTPEDSNWFAIKCGDIRRVLGPPLEKEQRASTTLNALTEDLHNKAQKLNGNGHHTAAPVTPSVVESLVTLKKHKARVGLYASNKSLAIILPYEIVTDFNRGYKGPIGFKADFTSPDRFVIRHGQADKPKPMERDDGVLFQCGGADVWERLGAFSTTPAEAWMENGCIQIKLMEKPRKQGAPRQQVELPPEPSVVASPIFVEPEHTEEFQNRPILSELVRPELVEIPQEFTAEQRCANMLVELRSIEADTGFSLEFNATERKWFFRKVVTIE
jgi:hypothetical protein